MRINKFLADKGLASRRHADEMVQAGRVTINGVVATLGANVEENDVVALDGKIIATSEKKEEYYIMNKVLLSMHFAHEPSQIVPFYLKFKRSGCNLTTTEYLECGFSR